MNNSKQLPAKISRHLVSGIAALLMLLPVTAYSVPVFQAAPGAELTLEQAVATAVNNSPVLKIAAENVRRAQGIKTTARGALNPALALSGQYTRYDQEETVDIGGGNTIVTQEVDAKRAQATLSFPIDVAGTLNANVSSADYQLLAAKLDYNATVADLRLNVTNAFLNVLRSREAQTVATEQVERLQEQLRLANVRFDAGSAPRFDVLRAQADLADAEQVLTSAQNSVRLSELALANTMGVVFTGDVNVVRPQRDPTTLPEAAALIEQGLSNRPEIASARASVEAARRGVKVARGGLLPSLAIDINGNWNGSTTTFSGRRYTAEAIASVRVPIFDGGVTRGQVQQAEANVGINQAQLEQTSLAVRLEVEQAYTDIVNARKRLSSAEVAVAQAQESLRLAEVRYANEVSIAVELTDAQVALTNAQNNVINARYDLYLAWARLARATANPEYQQVIE